MKYEGLYTAIITPFKDGRVDVEAYKALIEAQIAAGVDGIAPVGTTGESPTLSHAEHMDVIRIAIETVRGRVQVIAGTGSNSTAEAIAMTQEAERLGADGTLQVCPYYNKPTAEGLYRHFKAVADSTKLPVVLYNVPGRTGVNLKAETTIRLARDCENIVAIKEASGSLEQVDEIIKNKPSRFDVISGDDALTFQMVASGAAGVISVIGNALPKEFSRMIRLEFNGEYEPARKIHHRFNELYSLLFVDGNPAGVKALLHEMGFIDNVLRLPLVPTRLTTIQKISNILKDLKI